MAAPAGGLILPPAGRTLVPSGRAIVVGREDNQELAIWEDNDVPNRVIVLPAG